MEIKYTKGMTAAVAICMVIVIAAAACAPWLVSLYGDFRNIDPSGRIAILVSYYLCTAPMLTALYKMLRILRKISENRPFDYSNAKNLSVISWCCAAAGIICAAGGIFYPSLFLVCAAMTFLFLVVRVVCSCFKAAARLQEENDLTV
ncbi:MAG: DUF2975 domain-containing protein [Ruminococcus sp.]|nr:DUF2975 domain-containing protein [Ruminococcus sp.]